jgi:hypothetical protein
VGFFFSRIFTSALPVLCTESSESFILKIGDFFGAKKTDLLSVYLIAQIC